jgi:hypothetical protein
MLKTWISRDRKAKKRLHKMYKPLTEKELLKQQLYN